MIRTRGLMAPLLVMMLFALACDQEAATHVLTIRAVVRPERSVCDDPAGTDLEGKVFTVADVTGERIAEGTLGAGTRDALSGATAVSVCSFYGEASVPVRSVYSVSVDGGSNVTYTNKDLDEAGWVIVVPEETLPGV
jgi:hypothetical protein